MLKRFINLYSRSVSLFLILLFLVNLTLPLFSQEVPSPQDYNLLKKYQEFQVNPVTTDTTQQTTNQNTNENTSENIKIVLLKAKIKELVLNHLIDLKGQDIINEVYDEYLDNLTQQMKFNAEQKKKDKNKDVNSTSQEEKIYNENVDEEILSLHDFDLSYASYNDQFKRELLKQIIDKRCNEPNFVTFLDQSYNYILKYENLSGAENAIQDPTGTLKVEILQAFKDYVFNNVWDKINQNDVEKELKEVKQFGYDFFNGAPTTFSPFIDNPIPVDYKIGPGDDVKIIISGDRGKETVYDKTVDPQGKLYLPGLGLYYVNNFTIYQLENMLQAEVAQRYKALRVSASVSKIRSIRINATGDFKRPGAYLVSSFSTAFNAVYAAGGPSTKGSMRNIHVIRNNQIIATIDFYKYLLEGIKEHDINIRSGDTIFIPVIGSTVTVYGEVKRPAVYELKGEKTLSQVLKMAGGIKSEGYSYTIKITRIDKNKNMIILNYDAEKDMGAAVEPGDVISINKVISEIKNQIELKGHVYRPGYYAYKEGLTISELVQMSEGLKGEVYKEKADVYREREDKTIEIISFNLGKALNGEKEENILLKPKDKVVIYSPDEVVFQQREVAIKGSVEKPGIYNNYENMTIGDLIHKAGGLLPEAYNIAEIGRSTSDGKIEIITVDLNKALSDIYNPENIILQDRDTIFIKEVNNYKRWSRTVKLMGEVNYPGEYPILGDKDTLYDLIQRAGGLSDKAFPDGTVFVREISNLTEEEQWKIAVDINVYVQYITKQLSGLGPAPSAAISAPSGASSAIQGIINIAKQWEGSSGGISPREITKLLSSGRVPLDMTKILQTTGKSGNIILRDGDIVKIPERPDTILVLGAVMLPSAVLYEDHKTSNYYIRKTGGYAQDANVRRVVVIRANGEVLPKYRAGDVRAGDIIFVPTTALSPEKTSWQYFLDIVSIATNFYLLKQIFK